ncbi:MAG: HDOD domain-containing protein [Bryobacterales bacterium]|nr:HDOD domain-containing protein [Bryobacterales bacterium]
MRQFRAAAMTQTFNSGIEVPATLGKLPPFPLVALQALKALSSESNSAHGIEKLIAADVVFASSTLHCANSALFHLPQRVLTLRHAIVVLGRERLRCIILTVALQSFARAPLGSKMFRQWWRHSLATAILSEALAKASDWDTSGAYMGGLLHDIGRLGLIVQFPRERWKQFVAMAEAPTRAGMGILEIEREILGMDHAALGAAMLREWGIPQELIVAARHHHEPEVAARHAPAMFVAAACEMASRLGFVALKYPRRTTMEELISCLPEETAALLASDEEKLREAVETKIQSLAAG